MKKVFLLAILILLININLEAATYYVKQHGIGASGSDWDNALNEAGFRKALTNSKSGDVFYIAAGTYKPTADKNRYATFPLYAGVKIYGGFAANSSGAGFTNHDAAMAARDISAHLTILSGDLNDNDVISGAGESLTITNNFENVNNVVTSGKGSTPTTTVIDGFTIKGGNATRGGGIYNHFYCCPLISNCTFIGNFASSFGGGIYNEITENLKDYPTLNPVITNCTFSKNIANWGGAIYNRHGSSPTITNCTFVDNFASSDGAAIDNTYNRSIISNCTFTRNYARSNSGAMDFNFECKTVVTNCTFINNKAGSSGGVMDMETRGGNNITITNCILWGNTAPNNPNITSSATVSHCVIQDGYANGTNIITKDPNVQPLADNGGSTQTMALLEGSSAIATGTTSKIVNDNNVVPTDDQRGIARNNPPCIGAYEYIAEKKPYIECVENYKDTIIVCNIDTTIMFNIGNIRNKGTSDLVINKSKITNTLSIWQPKVNLDAPLNNDEYTIIPQSSSVVSLQYKIPQNTELKTYYDTISIWHNDGMRPNPWKIYVEITVQNLQIEINPTVIDFGTIEETQQVTQKVDIEVINKQVTASVKEVKLMFGEHFILTKTIPTGTSIGKDSVIVSPKTDKYGLLEDTLIVIISYLPCEDTFKIPIKVNVKDPGPVTFKIIASKHNLVKPSSLNYRIPIYVNSSVALPTVTIDTLILNMHKTIYYPRSIDKGKLSISYADTICEILICNISISNVRANVNEVLFTLRGNVLLGDIDSTDITITKCVVSAPRKKDVELHDGYLTLLICDEGGERFLKSGGHLPAIRVVENPVKSSILELECDVLESGNYSLEIIDILGNSQKVKEWKVTSKDNKKFKFSIPVDNYGNGNYIVYKFNL